MRLLGIVPVLLCITSIVLTFLCLFAGNREGFMEDYALVTLNTSRFGENAIQGISTSGEGDSDNPLQQLWNNITDTIQNGINNEINDLAREFGLKDFYSLHVLTYCEGYYEPGVLPNATLSADQIYKNTTECSNRTALFNWDPRNQIQAELNATGHDYIDITRLNWPDSVDDTIHDIQNEFKATFVLYCLAIAFMFFGLITAILSFFFLGSAMLVINVILDVLAFLSVGIASALVTAVMKTITKTVNGYTDSVGIAAYYSTKFLAITWVATALMFIASLVWCFDCVIFRRGSRRSRRAKGQDVKMENMKAYH